MRTSLQPTGGWSWRLCRYPNVKKRQYEEYESSDIIGGFGMLLCIIMLDVQTWTMVYIIYQTLHAATITAVTALWNEGPN